MAIMLTVDEIPKFWEAIKFATINGDMIVEDDRPRYINYLLRRLLSGKAQCFVRLSKERKLQMIGISEIVYDIVKDEKSLFLRGLYSFEKTDMSTWLSDFVTVKELAESLGCKTITSITNNDRVIQGFNLMGLRERSKMFIMDLNGGA